MPTVIPARAPLFDPFRFDSHFGGFVESSQTILLSRKKVYRHYAVVITALCCLTFLRTTAYFWIYENLNLNYQI